MTFTSLLNSLITDTWPHSLKLFAPELALCGTIVLMLLTRVLCWERCLPTRLIALAGTLVGLGLAAPWQNLPTAFPVARQEIFTGLLVYDSFTVYFRALLLLFAALFVVFTWLSGIPDREDSPDFYTLVLGATLGMCLMASSNHVLMLFLSVEMASVPSYALAGILKGRRQSSEAALKYSVYGAGASGVMLYGLSLLAGVLGSCHIPTMALQLADMLQSGMTDRYVLLALGGLMTAVGICFKLSAVPFHFWCPDVFEGACAEVNAFLSVASKAAALALLVRVAVGFGFPPSPPQSFPGPALAVDAAGESQETTQFVSADPPRTSRDPTPREAKVAALEPVRQFIGLVAAVIAAITCTFGNLAAYGQTNIKRLMAYSTIAHAGYMILPIAPLMFMAGSFPAEAEQAGGAIVLYTGIYLFMNLGAFAIIAFLRNALRSEQIADYAGLVRRSPGVVVCLTIIMLSLVGIPPLAGFTAKFVVFSALTRRHEKGAAGTLMLVLLVIAGLNTVVSLFYYLRVVKVMTIDPEPQDRAPADFSLLSLAGAFTVLVTAPVVALGIWWNSLLNLARTAVSTLLS